MTIERPKLIAKFKSNLFESITMGYALYKFI